MGDTPTATGVAIYRATAVAAFAYDDTTYSATVSGVVSPGNANINDTVSVDNVYNEAGAIGAELLLVEVFDDPGYSYLTLNVERQITTVITNINWNDGSGNIVVSKRDVPMLDPTDPADTPQATEECPP